MGRIGSALSFQDLSGQSLRCPAVPYPEKWPSSPHVPLASEDHTLGMDAMPRCANQDRSMPQFTTSMMRSDLQLGVAFITLSTIIWWPYDICSCSYMTMNPDSLPLRNLRLFQVTWITTVDHSKPQLGSQDLPGAGFHLPSITAWASNLWRPKVPQFLDVFG